jgi:putative endonuclease
VANPRHVLGERAERAAAEWLISRGWTILARRWRCPQGELDLVALDPDCVVVAIEVKVRRTGRAGAPLESIDRRRLRRLRAALGQFLAVTPAAAGDGIRVDLVAVRPGDGGRWWLAHHPAIDAW